MTTSREDALALDAMCIIDGSGARTRTGFVTNVCQDDYVTEVMADDPIGFWKCDETTGTTLANSATKSSGAADDLTLITGAASLNDSMTIAGVTYPGVDFDYDSGDAMAYCIASSAWLPQAFPYCMECVIKYSDNANTQTLMRMTVNESGSPYLSGGGDPHQTRLDLVSSQRVALRMNSLTYESSSYTQTGMFSDGELVHVFARCITGSGNGASIYINGVHARVLGSQDVFDAFGYGVLSVGGKYTTGLTGAPTCDSTVGLVAVYNTDVSGMRVKAHAAALRKHYDAELKGSTTAISAFAGSGGYAIESDGTAANHAEIGDPRDTTISPQSAGSILDDIGKRYQAFSHVEPDLYQYGGSTSQARYYTVMVVVSRDSYSDTDVILANNSSTSHANTVQDSYFGVGHPSHSYRGASDGFRLEIQADDTVLFTHTGHTIESTATITNSDATVITATWDGSPFVTDVEISLFVNGADKQTNDSLYPTTGYGGLESSGVTTLMAAADQDADGFDGRVGPLLFFPTLLSDAEILALSEKLLDEAGEGDDENSPPTGTVTISGTATEDQILTAANNLADEDGLGAISYQWKRGGAAIGGATNTTYTLVQADVGAVMTVTASYTDDGGTDESVTSTATSAVANVNDPPGGSVTISGTATEDQTLTADASGVTDEDGLGAFSYQWKRGGATISGATATTYTLVQADVDSTITVTASYTDGQGTAESITSAATAAVANVNDPPTGGVTISGTPTEDQTLTAANTLADEDGLGSISYQWKRGGVAISGATASTHTLTQADVGSTITVTASYTDQQGTAESATSGATASVANVNDPPTGTVSFSGLAIKGVELAAANNLVDEDGLGTISYQWKRGGVAISGATASTYTLVSADVGSTITVTASYTDLQGTAESVTSAPSEEVADSPSETLTLPLTNVLTVDV